jgi:LuxR family maltose regulon positive regulatory protein
VTSRRRAAGEVADVRARDLALDVAQAQELLAAAGAEVEAAAAEQLHAHTEGWPAGIYLAALALRAGAEDAPAAIDADRFAEDLLRTEHIRRLPPARQAFLRRTAVLDRMSAELCDAVLGRRDSGRVLAELEEANLFVTPLDRRRRWYRYHDLFREALLHELDRAEAGAGRELRLRAGAWCEQNGLAEDAMGYAFAAGDTDRVARLFLTLAFPLYRAGRLTTLELWLDEVDDAATLRHRPGLAAIGALVHALGGRAFQAERWLDAAERALGEGDPDPAGAAVAATVEALVCRRGVERMEADALQGVADLDPLSPLRPTAMWLLALATLLRGRPGESEVRLRETAEAAAASGATFVGVVASAQRALLALDRDDVPSARELVAAAEATTAPEHRDYVPLGLLHVAQARLHARDGDRERARERLALAQRIRPSLTHATPHYTVLTLVELGRAQVALGEVGGARSVALDATEVLARRPGLGVLEQRVEELRREIARVAALAERQPVGLSAAELRLLPLLTTHLTFPEIGQRLFLSPNTIKTQAISIYRKLGASSRREAVERAVELGLVDDVVGR